MESNEPFAYALDAKFGGKMSRFEEIKKYYELNNIKGYPDYYIQGWENKIAQELRFIELIGQLDLNNKRILDVGCGTGNLLEYISTRFTGYQYTGVDILPHMIDRAKGKGLEGQFLLIDLFKNNPFKPGSFDIIFSSGIFNLNLGNNKEFLEDALKIFMELSCRTISFNLLWDKSPDREDRYFYFSPEEVSDWLVRKYREEWETSILKGYLKNDFTVHLNKLGAVFV